jgi:DNA modification methylase
MIQLHHGDCLDVLRTMPDASVDAIVTDPPYGLRFMGKKWDYDVPSVEIWAECLRVLKPGGHLLAFAGTRTQHRMAARIEDAGFEIRDLIAWVYGCLSEDSEVLTENGWMHYHTAKNERILAYDVETDVYQWEKPIRWSEYRVEQDTAYRVVSDHTDQIVSRGHRCLVERDGVLAFVPADELAGVEIMPTLPDGFCGVPQGRGAVLQPAVQRALPGSGLGEARAQGALGLDRRQQGKLRAENDGAEQSGVEGRGHVFQPQGSVCYAADNLRPVPGGVQGHGTEGRVRDASPTEGGGSHRARAYPDGVRAPHQPRRDGQPAGKPDALCDQRGAQAVRARPSYSTTLATVSAIRYSGLIWCPTVSTGAFVARRNGKVFVTGNSGFPKSLDVSKAIDKTNGEIGRLHKFTAWMRTTGLSARQINDATGTCMGSHYLTDKTQPAIPTCELWAKLRPLCGDVPAWVDGLVDRIEAEREVVGSKPSSLGGTVAAGLRNAEFIAEHRGKVFDVTAPATPEARQWQGWGTALKPALEPITVARKPLEGTVAANVLQWGTGGINVDGCRVIYDRNADDTRRKPVPSTGWCINSPTSGSMDDSALQGRWPANLLHDGSDEVVGLFPETKPSRSQDGPRGTRPAGFGNVGHVSGSNRPNGTQHDDAGGSAARFFYTAKADATDRNDGLSPGERNAHPTVKPVDLMCYLCRLVTPPGGIVLDPFMGSGSTGKACVTEGFSFIGIERDADSFATAQARVVSPMPLFKDVL